MAAPPYPASTLLRRATPWMRATHSIVCLRSKSGRSNIFFQPCPQPRGCRAMALQAKRAHIGEIALPAAFHHWQDVVRIPKRFSIGIFNSPLFQEFFSRGIVETAHVAA